MKHRKPACEPDPPDPETVLIRRLMSGDPAAETLTSKGARCPPAMIDPVALRAAGWSGPGPLDACARCGRGAAWRAPDGRPYHARCSTSRVPALAEDS